MMLTYLTNIVKELSTKELIFVKNIYIGQTDYQSASNNDGLQLCFYFLQSEDYLCQKAQIKLDH